ncbi:MAG: DUF6569 family protein [Bacillota bacterium]
MPFSLSELLGAVTVGEPQSRHNLCIFPLFVSTSSTLSYLLLEEALELGVLEVSEVSEAGSVNAVFVTNNGDAPVLILDGEELVGAKQNRILNVTVLIPPKKKVEVPVSCVERGRWRYRSPRFSPGIFGYTTLRADKAAQVAENLATGGFFMADQGALWQEVDRKQVAMGVACPTDAVHDIYESYHDKLQEYVAGLQPQPEQAGVAVFINGRFSCLDLFNQPATLQKLWDKLLRSYALEALELKGRGTAKRKPELEPVLQAIREAEIREYPSVGQGTDIRLRGRGIVGAALVDEGNLLHLSVFATPAQTGSRSGIARPASRRRHIWDE